MTKKTIASAIQIAAVLSLLAFFAYTVNRVNTPRTYHVLKNGDCYTYGTSAGYVNSTCRSTYAEAEAAMRRIMEYSAKEKAFENRDWTTVTE